MTGRSSGSGRETTMQSIYSILSLMLILVACVELCGAATIVDVYRLIQYDISGAPFGSRLSGLNHHAGVYPFAPGTDLSRTVVLMPVRELNFTFLRDYIVNKKLLGGLLLLLPPRSSEKTDDDATIRGTLIELERLLIHSTIPYPVYFAFEDDKIDDILSDIRRSDINGQPASATTGGYKLVISTQQPKKISSPSITNIQGWLPGFKGDRDGSQLPTIAIVASYDTFGAAPALSVGSDGNGSGVVALLEIARLFSRLYSNPKTQGRYNLLFGLTSGGPYNYNGTMKWLRSFDQRLRETIDHAICLNNVGSLNNELWIHVSKPPENSYIKQVFEGMSEVARELEITFSIKHKKINISNPRVAWEHEQFSRSRVTAFTLSELSSAPGFLESTGGLNDIRTSVDATSITKTVKLVAESLARHIYGQGKNTQIFSDDGSLAVNPSYIKLWLDLLSRTPRVAPYLSKKDSLLLALKKELLDHTSEVSVQHDVLDGMFTFYDSMTAKLNIHQVASLTFDLILLLAVGSYLFILYCFLVITTQGLDDLISIFKKPPSRKVKPN